MITVANRVLDVLHVMADEQWVDPIGVEFAQREAKGLIDNDPDLDSYPDLSAIIRKRESVHME